jgi:hypothetical protein
VLRHILNLQDVTTQVQNIFDAGAASTLSKVDLYIRRYDAAIHVEGDGWERWRIPLPDLPQRALSGSGQPLPGPGDFWPPMGQRSASLSGLGFKAAELRFVERLES